MAMKSTHTTQARLESDDAAQEQETVNGGASLFVRLWAFGGLEQGLRGLTVESDQQVSELIHQVIRETKGQVRGRWPEGLVARFNNPIFALSAAKKLQQQLLTFHRPASPQQVVASVLVSGRKDGSGADDAMVLATAQMLVDASVSAAQILASEEIYELARHEPGFHFNPKPIREAGEGGVSETIYELLWTDESTYGHLRETGHSTGLSSAGRYKIQAELGRGAMGVVYKAYDQLIGRTVALKTISIDRNAPNRQELIERLKQEAKAAGGLDHPNIITIYDVGQEEDRVYLSMQFVEGKTLLALLAEDELPPLPTLISYAEQICSAVGFAHARGVIHRDLKPANLMLTSQGVIKVLDFGIAKLDDTTLTQTGLVVGTPMHMAPEQASDRKIDHRTDIFALGSVFYEMFTREKPFKGDVTTVLYKIVHEDPVPPSVINPGLPSGIDAIIRKALAKKPKDRFQTCEEMGAAFQEQAELLKSAGTGATVAMAPVKRPVAAPRAPSSSVSYLLDTSTVRPQRSTRLPVILLLLLAIGAAGGWAFYVKSSTGSFPPAIQKIVALARQMMPKKAAMKGAAEPGNSQQTVSAKSGQSAEGRPAGSSPESAVQNPTAAPQPATSNPEPAQSPAPLAANATAGEQSQPPVSTSTPATPSETTPASGTRVGAIASSQPPSDTKAQNPSTASDTSTSDSSGEPGAVKPTKKPGEEPAARVDGFTRRDVPDLLRQADAAAGRGDYKMARYEYTLILKLDRNNLGARTGLRNIQGR